jgi:predicted ATP-grasp superfamily ATP-dependent carboligase
VLSAASPPRARSDVVLLLGDEPNLHWRVFANTIVELAKSLGVETVVTLGALLADVPHTRGVRITGLSADAELARRLGASDARYEGPTGITGVLHDSCARAGLRSASLWAPVPHYVAAVSSPKAALALVQHLTDLLGVGVDTSDLAEATAQYERRLDEAVEREPEVKQLVERLEQQMDEQEILFGEIPSGDSIAREFQRYLREQGS